MFNRKGFDARVKYTVHQGSTWWLRDGSRVGKGHKRLQYLALHLRRDGGAFHEPEKQSQKSYSECPTHITHSIAN